MALQKNYVVTKDNFTGSLTASNAYFKVRDVTASKTSASMIVDVFTSQGGTGLDAIKYEFVVSLDGNNFIAQAYEHLKTLPEFAGATDV